MTSRSANESLIRFLVSHTRYSRRDLSEYIQAGKVSVDGRVVSSLTLKIDPVRSVIKLKDERIQKKSQYVYYKFYKPRGMLSTLSDPKDRLCLNSIMHLFPQLVFPVGRLDRQSSGLLLFSNDGDFANQVLHPSFSVSKEYQVTVSEKATQAVRNHLSAGAILDDGPVCCDAIHWQDSYHCTLHISEGRNRIVRRLFEFFGLTVTRLKRTAIGPIELGGLGKGTTVRILDREIQAFRRGLA